MFAPVHFHSSTASMSSTILGYLTAKSVLILAIGSGSFSTKVWQKSHHKKLRPNFRFGIWMKKCLSSSTKVIHLQKTISREWLTKKPFSIAKFESMITWMSFAWTSLFAKVWSLVVNISMTGLMWESKSSWLKFNLNSKKSLSPPNASIRNINSISQRFEEFQN